MSFSWRKSWPHECHRLVNPQNRPDGGRFSPVPRYPGGGALWIARQGHAQSTIRIDLARIGVEKALEAEAVALELDELPLPYRFDVRAFASIRNARLRAHIERVGIPLYRRDEAEVAVV